MILGVDIGGSSVKMALVDETGKIHARNEASVDFDGYKTPVIETVKREAKEFIAREGMPVEGVGVCSPGQIDAQAGVVIDTNGVIVGYKGTQIKKEMQTCLDLPVYVLNDANAAALGECFAGRGKGCRNMIMVTFGTGVGGGIVIDGRVYGGMRGIAGEIGQFVLYRDKKGELGSGQGWFEDYASTAALVCAARRILGEENLNGRVLFERAERGDQAVLAIMDEWMDDIAAGLSGLVHIFNPEMIVLGGGVSSQQQLFVEPLRRKVLAASQLHFREGLKIESALLGNEAGVLGAARYFMEMQAGAAR